MIHLAFSPFREFGVTAGFLYSIDRMLSRLSRRSRLLFYELTVQPLVDQPYTTVRAVKAFDHREIKPGDAVLTTFPVPAEVIEHRFQQGAICLGVFRNTRIAGYIWLAF